MTGLLLKVVVAICAGSTLASIISEFQAGCGVTTSVVAAGDEPSELLATIENVYVVPFFSPVISTGLVVALLSAPVLRFLTV